MKGNSGKLDVVSAQSNCKHRETGSPVTTAAVLMAGAFAVAGRMGWDAAAVVDAGKVMAEP